MGCTSDEDQLWMPTFETDEVKALDLCKHHPQDRTVYHWDIFKMTDKQMKNCINQQTHSTQDQSLFKAVV